MELRAQEETTLRLFPGPVARVPLHGLYLDETLRPSGTPADPVVYASFVVSLDDRISLPDPKTGVRKPPTAITNRRDWRLFQELAASADVVVTSGRYIRDLAAGVAQDSLPISAKPEFADLLSWRRAHDVAQQPAVAIVTGNVDFPIPDALLDSGRSIYMVTGGDAQAKAARLTRRGVRLLEVGHGSHVEGRALIRALAREGFGNIYMTAGGALLRSLVASHAFDRLYLTRVCTLLGGNSFDTLLKGPPLDPVVGFRLCSLFYDATSAAGPEQLLVVLESAQRAPECP